MTERLSQLLHEEVAELHPVPAVPSRVLAEGRRLRRRRRLSTGVAVAAAVAVVGAAGGYAISQSNGAGPDLTNAGGDAPVVFGVGSKVYVDDAVATVPDTIHSFHYTSEGVLVRSNPNDGASDGSGPETLTLVRNDGTTVALGTIPEGVGPATDSAESVYVLAEARGEDFVAVVRDVETGETVEEVPLPDLRPSYWEVPPLSLDGSTLYVGYRSSTVAIDLATGEQHTVDGIGGLPIVAGGRLGTTNREGDFFVVDTTTGEEVLLVDSPDGDYSWGTLSPDGRFLKMNASEMAMEQGGESGTFAVYDVAAGSKVEIEGDGYGWGWTASGELFRVAGDTVTTCDAGTGQCRESPAPTKVGKNAHLRLGGLSYES
ncbi:hypothetical protein [Nocardioides sp.]|uniref:hypothetical protein n=1 Tax=Nocardioides sp. TaxID=35761 RepID=UPI002ED62F12